MKDFKVNYDIKEEKLYEVRNFWSWMNFFVVLLSVLVLFAVLRDLAFVCVQVSGNSMYPTLEDGDYLLVNSSDNEFHRGEVVVFYNESLEKLLIKRVVAVPGDTVCTVNGDVYIKKYGETEFSLVYEPYVRQPHRTFRSAYLRGQDMEAVTVGEDSVFVLGDNRTDSYDSRGFGAVPVDCIVGSVSEFVIYWRYPLQFLYRMF